MSLEILKELKRKKASEKAVQEMLAITFNRRTERIKTHEFQPKEVMPNLCKEFPYLKNEMVVRYLTCFLYDCIQMSTNFLCQY